MAAPAGSLTPAELERVMSKVSRDSNRQLVAGLHKAIRAGAAAGMADGEVLRILDRIMGADFDARNDMSPDPR